MSRETYIIPFTITNPTTVPFLQIATPTNAGLAVLEFHVGQTGSTTSAQVEVQEIRRTGASTLPTAATISALDPAAPATRLASSTTTNAYGIASVTGAAGATLKRWNFNILSGLFYTPVPLSVSEMDISQFLTYQFTATPTAATYTGYVIVQEL